MVAREVGEVAETTPADHDPRWRLTPTKIIVTVLLLIGIIVPLLVSTYDQIEPRLFGFPFFYWYQLLWVFICAALVSTAHFLMRRDEARRKAGRTSSTRSDGAGR